MRIGVFVFGALAACTWGSSDDNKHKLPDAPVHPDVPVIIVDAPPDAPPMALGMHYHYVVDKEYIPTNNTQARMSSLDLNGDQTVDNQFGMVLGALGGQGFDFQAPTDKTVDRGQSILLVDVQTTAFTSATDAGVTTFEGDTPVPPACQNANDMVCRHHLTGSGTFNVAASSTRELPLVGDVVNGTFTTTSRGKLYVPLAALGGSYELVGARVQLGNFTASGITGGILAGGILKNDLDTKFIPRFQMRAMAQVTADCSNTDPQMNCGCTDGSTGKSMIGLFDTMPKDCAITVDEIKNNSLIMSLLAPDITIDGQDALSYGMRFDAVPGVFTP